jgi:carboxyl-terminal processing protease
MRRAIQALEKQQVKGYVLDLRSDPGGLLTSGLEIASQWLHQGSIVSVVNREQEKEQYTANGSALTDKPLVVLVDGGSASASEIVAGALQDRGRAILVGSRTFGKGLVQAIQPLDDGSALKLTIAKYYTPQGKDINHVGIIPNVTVELSEAQQRALIRNHALGTAADPQYASAIAQLLQILRTGTTSSTLQNH